MIEVAAHPQYRRSSVKTASHERSSFPFTDLNMLAHDRELLTPEIFSPNDFYGHAAILKDYAGIAKDESLKTSVEHALFFADFAWDLELNCPLPAMLVTSPLRFQALRKRSAKALFAIGPMILYAPQALDLQTLESERQRLGRSLLVMPSHSTHHITAEYDIAGYCRYLKMAAREFNTVRVCLYWKDILLGRDKPYRDAGFECVTAGHMFDPLFLPRLKSIITLSTVATSNVCGTHVGLTVALNRPHVIAHPQPKNVTANSIDDIQRDFNAAEYENPQFLEVVRAFSQWTDSILPGQQELVSRCWGLGELRSREEMRLILQIADDMYRNKFLDSNIDNCVMQRQIDLCRASGHHRIAAYLRDHLSRYNHLLEPNGKQST